MDRDQIYEEVFGPIHENAKRLRWERKLKQTASGPNNLVLKKIEEIRERKAREEDAGPNPEEPPDLFPIHHTIEQSMQADTPVDRLDDMIQAAVAPSTIDDLIIHPQAQTERALDPFVTPYRKGEDINQDYSDYLHAIRIGGRTATPVLGEDVNFYLGLRAIASGISTLFEGRSRSGKTLLQNRIKELLPSSIEIGGASNNALLDRADEINDSGYVVFSEYQAVVDGNPRIKEATKCISEDADYHFTSLGTTRTLKGGLTILGTGADENKRTQNRDVEVSGRFIILKTQSSQEKIRIICDHQDGIADGTITGIDFTEEKLERLKRHYRNVLKCRGTAIENPFAKGYSETLPETQKSLHYRTLYHGLINGSTRFEAHNRLEHGGKLLTHLCDVFLIHRYYHDAYCDTLQRLSVQSYHSILKGNEHLAGELKAAYDYEMGLIERARVNPVDWEKVWHHGLTHMRKKNPGSVEEWVAMQSRDRYLLVDDPIRKETVRICEARPW